MAVKGYHSGEQIILESLANIRDFDQLYYKEAAMYFLSAWREFQLFESGGQVKTAWRPITPINTVNYPEDLMRLIDVSIIDNGEYFSFTKSDKLADPITDPLDLVRDDTRGETQNVNRFPVAGYGAKGSNLEYYYKEDKQRRRVVLSRMAVDKTIYADRSEVLLRYVSSGIDDFATTYIADDAANMLIAYVVYKLVKSRPDKYSLGYVSMMKEDYIEQLRMYRALEMPSLDELEDMIYESSGQNVRR